MNELKEKVLAVEKKREGPGRRSGRGNTSGKTFHLILPCQSHAIVSHPLNSHEKCYQRGKKSQDSLDATPDPLTARERNGNQERESLNKYISVKR